MNDTHSKIEATITYILGLIWQQGEALRAATDAKTRKSHVRAIHVLADAARSLVYAHSDPDLSLSEADEGEPQPLPQDEDEPQEEPQPE